MSKPRTGAPKRVAVGLLAGALAMFGVALAPPAGAAASVTTDRLAGTTRYGTAQAISANSSFSAPTTAIVATGENFPDALAASTLAGANVQAPIILTETGVYTADAKAALAALKAKGVSAITIVGGTSAVAQSVEDAIKADGFTVTRVAGDDRYETAAAIATAANTKSAPAAIGGLKTALIATGLNSPDALAAGPAAAANKLPLLLVNDAVPAETSNAISTLGIKKVVILGGTAAVSPTVEAALVAATGNPATRLAGINRYSTATAIADYEKSTLAFPMTSVILANGPGVAVSAPNTGFFSPDALAAGPLGGIRKAPVLLTADPLSTETAAWLDANSATINTITAVGGTAAISDAVLAAAKAAAQTVGNDSANKAVTTRPELTGAQVLSTTSAVQVTPTNPIGTKVRYTFDEALGTGFSPVATNFKVWDASNGSNLGTTASIETGTGTTGTTVVVNFAGVATTAGAAALTKATVAFGAVRDVGGAENPEGDAPIGTAGTTPSSAGTTAAPDLKTVGGFRQASQVGQTAVDFTFDQNAFVATTTAFHLVDTLNNDTTCTGPASGSTTTGGGTVAGGEGTPVITVICNNVGGTVGSVAGTPFSSSNVARGYVAQGGVANTAAGAQPIPLEAADVAATSLGPDLVSVSYNSTSGAAVFTFDQTVSTATNTANQFRLYLSTGAESLTGGTPTINSSNATQVSVTFTAGLAAVGGNVLGNGTQAGNGAVRGTDGTYNQPDEEGFAGSSSTVTPGRTSGPDLTAVALAAITDAFGNTTGFSATYTFDVAATTAVAVVGASAFHVYLADGTRYNGSACVAGDGGTTNGPLGTAKCTAFVNSNTGAAPATATTLQPAVLGTVGTGAVTDSLARPNSEGAAPTTGGNGTPAS
ncbi:MAG: cell wall-binding repeat-containing protein [Acidimicrobiales bacterium]|nr:cell wall-binding repeat-containing protein [Acidimicrobiales bacterium]